MEHISIHALREEGDGAPHPAGARTQHFYPRPPRGGRRSRNSSFGKSKVFLSTPSARRATTRGLRRSCRGPISIHALREEGDAYTAECMEALKVFLSTPSARRATYARRRRADGYVISIHALREEGDRHLCRCGAGPGKISIHALREEGDRQIQEYKTTLNNFYPRPPRGGRHADSDSGRTGKRISIHALREEGDTGGAGRKPSKNISIHALREEGDLPLSGAANVVAIFLSTPSTRRATRLPGGLGRVPDISIHALREEGDRWHCRTNRETGLFLSTPSARRATLKVGCGPPKLRDFYPRPPRGGRPPGRHYLPKW